MNQCTFMGNLTKDPVLTELKDGKFVVNFRIATNRFYKRSDGENANEATYLDLEAWDTGAKYICEIFKTGDPILVETSARNVSWIDKDGIEKRKTIFRVNKFYPLAKKK